MILSWGHLSLSRGRLYMSNTLRLFVFLLLTTKVHINSGCVCRVASVDHVHTASVDRPPHPTPLNFPALLTCTAVWNYLQRCSSQHMLCRGPRGNTLPSRLWPQHGSLHPTGSTTQPNCNRACQLWAVWIWSTGLYPYLLMYVLMNSSPVIVFCSLQDKWSLKETLVWIC